MTDFTIRQGGFCPVCRGIVLRDCSHTMRELRDKFASDAGRDYDALAAVNAALRAELAFARSTGDESALEYHALKARLAEAERHLALVLPMAKGYASAHRVGANAEIVEDAAEFLRATDSADAQRAHLHRIADMAADLIAHGDDSVDPPFVGDAVTVTAVDQQSGAQHE